MSRRIWGGVAQKCHLAAQKRHSAGEMEYGKYGVMEGMERVRLGDEMLRGKDGERASGLGIWGGERKETKTSCCLFFVWCVHFGQVCSLRSCHRPCIIILNGSVVLVVSDVIVFLVRRLH